MMAYGMGGFGMLMMLAVLILIVVVLVSFFRGSSSATGSDQASDPNANALSILSERYARGEIDHDEYEERKKRLT